MKGHRKLVDVSNRTRRPVNYCLTGHYHTTVKTPFGFANGSVAGYNEYARDLRADPEVAQQNMITVHAAKGVIRFDQIYLGAPDEGSMYAGPVRHRTAARGPAGGLSMIIIGLCGLAGAGKSTAARHLVERHGFVRRPFAALLKGMLRYLLHAQGVPAGDVERMVDGDLKEVLSPHFGGRTPRLAMQTLGTEWGRALSPDLWVNAWARSIDGLERVVADDVRFENEASTVRRMGGSVVKVIRPGVTALAGDHASEAGVIADVNMINIGTPAEMARDFDIWLDL